MVMNSQNSKCHWTLDTSSILHKLQTEVYLNYESVRTIIGTQKPCLFIVINKNNEAITPVVPKSD